MKDFLVKKSKSSEHQKKFEKMDKKSHHGHVLNFFCRISKQKTIRHYPLNVCQFRAWGQLQTFPVRCLARCVTEK